MPSDGAMTLEWKERCESIHCADVWEIWKLGLYTAEHQNSLEYSNEWNCLGTRTFKGTWCKPAP